MILLTVYGRLEMFVQMMLIKAEAVQMIFRIFTFLKFQIISVRILENWTVSGTSVM
ncbi:hypothetical protein D9M71_715090 [compost metagenome]